MSLNQWLIHRCSIQQLSVAQSATGELVDSYQNAYTDVSCRVYAKDQEIASPVQGDLILTRTSALFPPGTTIGVHDRITDIVDSDGASVMTGTYEVERVLTRRARNSTLIRVDLELRS